MTIDPTEFKIDLDEVCSSDWVTKTLQNEPRWCSVDLSEGNQSLEVPMTTAQKLGLFTLLVELGFKRIEVGSPGAYDSDFEFVRLLIENKLIPDDVTIQVVSQMKEKLILKTFEAIYGAKNVSLNLFHSTALKKRQFVLSNAGKESLIQKAIMAFSYAKHLHHNLKDTALSYQYSMESFNTTSPTLLVDLVSAVVKTVGPSEMEPLICNFWLACDSYSPHLLASRVCALIKQMKSGASHLDFAFRSHNDRGCSTALSEMMLLCGVNIIEGGLFGLGYRAGSTCLTTLALNILRMNVDVSLDLSDLVMAKAKYEEVTSHHLSDNHPYVGEHALSSFAPHEQYAIYRSLKDDNYQQTKQLPYVPLLPCQIGRSYESLIRINALSGRTGIAYIMENRYDFHLPYDLQREFSSIVKKTAINSNIDISEDALWNVFSREYLCYETPLHLKQVDFEQDKQDETLLSCHAIFIIGGCEHQVNGIGNGALDSLTQAIYKVFDCPFEIRNFQQHAMGHDSKAKACAYVNVAVGEQISLWGVGVDNDATLANMNALISAVNRLIKQLNPNAANKLCD